LVLANWFVVMTAALMFDVDTIVMNYLLQAVLRPETKLANATTAAVFSKTNVPAASAARPITPALTKRPSASKPSP
jgi:hypothetical protein